MINVFAATKSATKCTLTQQKQQLNWILYDALWTLDILGWNSFN